MLNRLLPHPGLTGFLILFWLVLANSWTFGSLVMATLLGLAIPIFTAPWWPDRPRLRHPLGLVSYTLIVLAGTVTMTPGTLTAEISADGRQLLIHALHAPDPDAVRDAILDRYESRLKRIFG